MRDHHRSCLFVDRGGQQFRAEVQFTFSDVNESRYSPRGSYQFGGSNWIERTHDDFVVGLQVDGLQRQSKCGRTVVDGDGVLRPHELRELELPRLRAD